MAWRSHHEKGSRCLLPCEDENRRRRRWLTGSRPATSLMWFNTLQCHNCVWVWVWVRARARVWACCAHTGAHGHAGACMGGLWLGLQQRLQMHNIAFRPAYAVVSGNWRYALQLHQAEIPAPKRTAHQNPHPLSPNQRGPVAFDARHAHDPTARVAVV